MMLKVAGFFIFLIAFILGIHGVWERIVSGHTLASYGSYVTWGLWVAAYIYFIGLSAGAFLLSSLIYVFGLTKLEKIGKLALFVALVTLFMALLSIWFDLGHMERFYYVFTRPNFKSMMAWMVWLYTAYFILILVEMWFAMRQDLARISGTGGLRGRVASILIFGKTDFRDDRKYLKVLGSIGVPLAIAFHGGVGALFGTVMARPYWHTALFPILFLTGALLSGGAFITVISVFIYKDEEIARILSRIVLGLLLFDLMLEWAEYSIPMWYGIGPEYKLLIFVLFGKFWWVFWIFHILFGAIIPLILLIKPNLPKIATAGVLIAVTYMAVRLNIVIPGLIEPQVKGIESAFFDPRLRFEYMPSIFEWQVVLFVVCAGIILFYAGLKFLPIKEE